MDEQLNNETIELKDLSDRTNLFNCENFDGPFKLLYEDEFEFENPEEQLQIPLESRVWEKQSPRYWYRQRLATQLQKQSAAEVELFKLKEAFERFSSQMRTNLESLECILETEQIAKFNRDEFLEDKRKKDEQVEIKRQEDAAFLSDLRAALNLMEQGYKPSQTNAVK